ncbi:MAG TPA: hypothetical protein VKC66_24890 [Xanthobacteraceae bacterium]|nr:hypothetical protein [Xanthobacteraceae bacterium]
MHIFEDAAVQTVDLAGDEAIVSQDRIDPSTRAFSVKFDQDDFVINRQMSFEDFNLRTFHVEFQNLCIRKQCRIERCDIDCICRLLADIKKARLSAVIFSKKHSRSTGISNRKIVGLEPARIEMRQVPLQELKIAWHGLITVDQRAWPALASPNGKSADISPDIKDDRGVPRIWHVVLAAKDLADMCEHRRRTFDVELSLMHLPVPSVHLGVQIG